VDIQSETPGLLNRHSGETALGCEHRDLRVSRSS